MNVPDVFQRTQTLIFGQHIKFTQYPKAPPQAIQPGRHFPSTAFGGAVSTKAPKAGRIFRLEAGYCGPVH